MNYSINDLVSNRQKDILWQVMENYIDTSEPVASQAIADKLGVSSATIRNEFIALDELGLTASPHTSSGRIPTDLAYKFYIEKIRGRQSNLPAKFQKKLKYSYRQANNPNEALKNLAKNISEFVQGAVAINLEPNIIFLTGFSYIFRQPEFSSPTEVISLSRALDELENNFNKMRIALSTINHRAVNHPEILVGSDNPFGVEFGTVILPLHSHFLTVLGPSRMNYTRAVSCLNFVNSLYNI